ncbi:hypothetical protein F9441_01355 [Escherichia coli]|uniref:hypothetical protein n=1 Tax=Klebsiella grimontii TaxID=2058152 RepID=UPI00185E8F32|nr:hypothetical protein [Klebsiella grimontii]EFH3926734.1 hypothetical protein [Escherichia coli]HAT7496862.1 hypothetical protein [Raoultella ornithinolytica]HCP2932334.1 hypothetical protein [Escherichia coli]
MSNSFDFELVADDRASAAIDDINEAIRNLGPHLEKNKDGSVNTLKTLESIAKIFPTLRPDQQKSAADGLGMTPELLTLMREGALPQGCFHRTTVKTGDRYD